MDLSSNFNISELLISINVLGDINFKITKFTPKMTYSSSYQNTILFVPNIPITLDSLIKSNVAVKKNNYIPSDFINVFSNPTLLNKVIRYIKQRSDFKPTSIEDAERKGYIRDNINLILSIYFANDNKISINYKKYPIHSYQWDEEYQTVKSNKKLYDYKINIDLYVLDTSKTGKSSERRELTCDKKRRNIALDLKSLGIDINIPLIGTAQVPTLGSSIRGPYDSNYIRPNYRPIKRGGKYKSKRKLSKLQKNNKKYIKNKKTRKFKL